MIDVVSGVKVRQSGKYLKSVRTRLGLSLRTVAALSQRVASTLGGEEYVVSHARLAQIESQASVPSIYKLFTLSVVYCVSVNELLSAYVQLPELDRLQHSIHAARTHVLPVDGLGNSSGTRAFLARIDSVTDITASATCLLSHIAKDWADVPLAFIKSLDHRNYRYGWIGLADYTMYPLIPPGSFAQIDERQRVVHSARPRTEYDRPVYFLEMRSGYICSWCEVNKGRLLSIPCPLSPCRTREFAFPSEIEVVGRVTGVAIKTLNRIE
jgi:transcriptional regulator with XRE-family HTH domain